MRVLPVAILALVAGSGAAPAKLPDPHGWGKPNISYLQYRTDMTECGYIASQVKMPGVSAMTPPLPVPSEIGGTPALGAPAADPGIDMLELYVQSYQQYTAMTAHTVIGYIEASLDQCMESRGYRPFRVTHDQMAGLRRLQKGTVARYHYIYRLGTDPRVLETQGL